MLTTRPSRSHLRHVSVDPGYSGAIVSFHSGTLASIWDMPVQPGRSGKKKLDITRLVEIVRCEIFPGYTPCPVYIEYVSAMPKQGVTSVFNFGFQAGALQAVFTACGHDVRLITPVMWKRHFNLLGKEKEDARLLALKKFPNDTDRFKLKKHHGRADAALIGLAGYELEAAGKDNWLH